MSPEAVVTALVCLTIALAVFGLTCAIGWTIWLLAQRCKARAADEEEILLEPESWPQTLTALERAGCLHRSPREENAP